MTFSVDYKLGAEEQYLNLLRTILQHGNKKGDRTGTGTRDLFGYQLRMDLQKGFPLLTTKKMFHRGLVEELLWMMRGDTNVKTLQEKNVHIWDEWATAEKTAWFGRSEGDLGPIYGHQWRRFGAERGGPGPEQPEYEGGFDQLSAVLGLLRTNPFSRRIIVTGWNPIEADQVALPPCHTLFQFSVRDEEGNRYLDCQLYQRSADVFLGVPFNIASYALLTHILAGLTGMKPGVFIHTFGSVHIYNNHFSQVQEQLKRDPYPLPSLRIKTFEPEAYTTGPSTSFAISAMQTMIRKPHTLWTLDEFLKECKGAEDFEFLGYHSYPAIKAEVSV